MTDIGSAERRVVKPPLDVLLTESDRVFFLLGPIYGATDATGGSGAVIWHNDAIREIHDRDSGIIIASPHEYVNEDSDNQQHGEEKKNKQQDWERRWLETASGIDYSISPRERVALGASSITRQGGVIVAFFPPQAYELPNTDKSGQFHQGYGYHSANEIGRWAARRAYEEFNLVVGFGEGFDRRYISREIGVDLGEVVPIREGLVSTIETALEMSGS